MEVENKADRLRRTRYLEEIAKTAQIRNGAKLGSAPPTKLSQTVDYSGVSVYIVSNDGEIRRRGLPENPLGVTIVYFDGRADASLHNDVAPIAFVLGQNSKFKFETEYANIDFAYGTGIPLTGHLNPGFNRLSGFGFRCSGTFDGIENDDRWAPVVIAHGHYKGKHFVGLSAHLDSTEAGGIRPAGLLVSAIMPKEMHDFVVTNNCAKLEDVLRATLPDGWMDYFEATKVKYTPEGRVPFTYLKDGSRVSTSSTQPYYREHPKNVFTAPRIIVKAVQK